VSEKNVIDFHIHIGRKTDWLPWVNDYFKKINPYLFQHFEELMNPAGLENYLTNQGIKYAVILAEYSPKVTGTVTNEFVYEFCKGHKRFIPFASINPSSTSQPEMILEKCVKDMNFQGLKLYPTYQHFFPNHKNLYPLYEKIVELKIPVMFHTGSSIYKNSKLKYGDPLYLDDLATDFPEMKIIMAHSGRGFWYDKAFFLSRLHKNLFMEISGLPPQNLLRYFPDFEKNIDKIIFGSDWPGVKNIRSNIEIITNLPLKTTSINKLLYNNAKRLLKL
jgi:predicted TIM-barrel fold metal-dependent hydrolase